VLSLVAPASAARNAAHDRTPIGVVSHLNLVSDKSQDISTLEALEEDVHQGRDERAGQGHRHL
jgi:hypothetical protein